MGKNRPSAAEKRLAHVRALKNEFYNDEPSADDLLAEKDARIAELEREVDILRARLKTHRAEPETATPPPTGSNLSRD